MVVAASLGRAVAGKVLHTRHNVGVRREIALIATHQRFGDALRVVRDNLDHKNFYAFNPEFDRR